MSLRDHIEARLLALRGEVDAAKVVISTNLPLIREFEALLAADGQELETDDRSSPRIGRTVDVYQPNGDKVHVAIYKPSIAVKKFLADKPHGIALKTLVDELQDKIDTNSPDPKRILYNTIFNLRKRGALLATKDKQGREGVRLADGEKIEEE